MDPSLDRLETSCVYWSAFHRCNKTPGRNTQGRKRLTIAHGFSLSWRGGCHGTAHNGQEAETENSPGWQRPPPLPTPQASRFCDGAAHIRSGSSPLLILPGGLQTQLPVCAANLLGPDKPNPADSGAVLTLSDSPKVSGRPPPSQRVGSGPLGH